MDGDGLVFGYTSVVNSFHVQVRDCFNNTISTFEQMQVPLVVTIVDLAQGVFVTATVDTSAGNGLYHVEYQPTVTGTYQISVVTELEFEPVHVDGSPVEVVIIDTPAGDQSFVVDDRAVMGYEDDAMSIVRRVTDIAAGDERVPDFPLFFDASVEQCDLAALMYTDHLNGTYTVRWSTLISGDYRISVLTDPERAFMGARHVRSSPFENEVAPAANVRPGPIVIEETRAVGVATMEGLTAPNENVFFLYTYDEYGNPVDHGGLDFDIEFLPFNPDDREGDNEFFRQPLPSGNGTFSLVDVDIEDLMNGAYRVNYTTPLAGTFAMVVLAGDDDDDPEPDEHILGSPFVVQIRGGAKDLGQTSAFGTGLQFAPT